MSNWREKFEKLRVWIDGDRHDGVPQNIITAHENKSESEVFLQKLLNSIEELLKKEIIRIPNTHKAYVPEKFLVFVSPENDKTLNKDKRRFFEESLSSLILERAKEMAGGLELTSKKIAVEILINATLVYYEIEVKVGSDNDQTRLTTIQFFQQTEPPKPDKPVENLGPIENPGTVEDLGTIEDFDTTMGILFRVEIWQSGKKISEIPVIQRRLTIGRDDADKVANLRLPTDNRKISRTHAEINLTENGEVWVTALHKNPVFVSGKSLRNGQTSKLESGGEIQIYDFTLKLKFAE